ncbi:MAG: tRNA uridine-5-carboxymethylaminomethyl(34) synthesis GTPase MnmE [Acidobacteria bacterium]|nr:tRNA uridine-5-carboxymethylaminomethyl(34) synthesis GTPase MnmE [Acidobacteriota bacterium]
MIPTIVASATPRGRSSALAIVRISGPKAFEIALGLCSLERFEPRRATVVRLRDALGPIDQAVVTAFEGPETYTGEDLVEFSTHGSEWVVERLIDAVVRRGARIAQPGEFTERAVANGRIDLVQAEAVGDLIASRTEMQARLSMANLEGRIGELSRSIRQDLVELESRLEAELDFADEGVEFIAAAEGIERLSRLEAKLEDLAGTHDRGRAIRRGVTVAILGRPNSGKSTLMNVICGEARSIVTEIPGTTRDVVSETVEIGGFAVRLLDTAGLRDSEDVVERIGVERARAAGVGADVVLYLIDSTVGKAGVDEEELSALRMPAMVVYSKADLGQPPAGALAVSALEAGGLSGVIEALEVELRERFGGEDEGALVNERQREAVVRGAEAVGRAIAAWKGGDSVEYVASEVREASEALGELTGEITRAEVIRSIFASFCIGK